MAKATKCLLDISKALAVQFDISFTGNPNGQLLLLVSINRAPLTGFDAGGHLAPVLLWSPATCPASLIMGQAIG